jgi:hypothetical protein
MTRLAVTAGFVCSIVLISAACSGADGAPGVLRIELLSYSPEQLIASDDLKDDLALVVHYDDPDGDLGGGMAEVQDCRGAALHSVLDLPAIASAEAIAAKARITGELTLHVEDIGPLTEVGALPALCREGEAQPPRAGEARFCLRLVDSAGHVSNVVCTGAIAVK